MILSLFFSLFVTAHGARAEGSQPSTPPLTPGEKLRRLSLVLRGLEPSRSDLNWVESLPTDVAVRDFLESTARSYVRSDAFFAKTLEKFSEVARWDSPTLPAETLWSRVSSFGGGQEKASMSFAHDLILRVLKSNLPWDQILVSKTFRDPFNNPNFLVEEVQRSSETSTRAQSYSPIFKADPSDHRFSGILNLTTFLEATPANSNKEFYRRAAAILRIFHCVDMKAANIPAKSEKSLAESFALGGALDDAKAVSAPPVVAASSGPKNGLPLMKSELPAGHAGLKQCRVCHDQLDPIAHLYKAPSEQQRDMRLPAPKFPPAMSSTLLFRDGSRPHVTGIAGLAQALAKSPEFSRCQSQRLAAWFSPDAPPPTAAEQALMTEKFEALGRRPQDYVVWAVLRNLDLRSSGIGAAAPQFPQSAELASISRKCMTCHKDSAPLKDFSAYLIPSPEGLRVSSHVARVTDIPGQGATATMPPESFGRLTRKEYEVLRNWVEFQQSAGQAKLPTARWACFPTPQDYARRFQQMFGHLSERSYYYTRDLGGRSYDQIREWCGLGGSYATLAHALGRADKESGERIYPEPHSGLLIWYKACVKDLSGADIFISLVSQDFRYQPTRYLPDSLVKLLESTAPPPEQRLWPRLCTRCAPLDNLIYGMPDQHLGRSAFLQRPWTTLSVMDRMDVVFKLADRVFPLGSLESSRLEALLKRVVGSMNVTFRDFSIIQAMVRIQEMFLSSDEFLFFDPNCERAGP